MNCPDNDFDECEEYQIFMEQCLALNRLFSDAQESRRFFMAHVISNYIQTVVERRAAHFNEHYQVYMAKR